MIAMPSDIPPYGVDVVFGRIDGLVRSAKIVEARRLADLFV